MPITSSMSRFASEEVNAAIPCPDCDQHQQLLDEQLDWLTVDHDDLREDILDRIKTPRFHPSMTVIDQWEQETIARIRQTAFRARRTLIDALDQYALNVNETLNTLTPTLRQARHRIQPFDENDIREWAILLQKLKKIPELSIGIVKNKTYDDLTINLTNEERTSRSISNQFAPPIRGRIPNNPIASQGHEKKTAITINDT